jgi:hypothetical protein
LRLELLKEIEYLYILDVKIIMTIELNKKRNLILKQMIKVMMSSDLRSAAFMLILLISISNISGAQSTVNDSKKPLNSPDEITQLFNGKDLNNWVFKLKDPSVEPTSVFSIREGVIHITGNPFGYMRTRESFHDYKLHVEWRWPIEASNSGVFVHAQPPDSIWLRCVECQLKAGSAGDFVCMNGSDMNERTDKSKVFVPKLAGSSEKPIGEWNIMEIICSGNTIEVKVNGILQNKGTNVNISSGSICLQSEGKDIEFRNVFLTTLKNK